MDLHHRIDQHRIRYIIDSYRLTGPDPQAIEFESYMDELLAQYPSGLIELALVETLTKNWLTVPMQKGVSFLSSAHERLQQWQTERQQQSTSISVTLTPSQFLHITGLDPKAAFSALDNQPHRPDTIQPPSMLVDAPMSVEPMSVESSQVQPSQ